jgi:hypothetical protein
MIAISKQREVIAKSAGRTTSLTDKFILFAATVLIITSCAKLASTHWGSLNLLNSRDGLFSYLSERNLLLITGIGEMLVAYVLISRRPGYLTKLSLIMILSTCFIAYRAGFWLYHIDGPCPCLGTLTGWLPVFSQRVVSYIMLGIAICLFAGSYVGIAYRLKCESK